MKEKRYVLGSDELAQRVTRAQDSWNKQDAWDVRQLRKRFKSHNKWNKEKMMAKKLALLGLGLLLCAGMAKAQGCTYAPVTVSKAPAPHDDGKGPQFWFPLAGYGQQTMTVADGSTVYITAGHEQVDFFQPSEEGYVNVFSQFGGCHYPWSANDTNQNWIYDTTINANIWVGGVVSTGFAECGAVASCWFNYSNQAPGVIRLQVGHTYIWYNDMYATISGGGEPEISSPTYVGRITIIVQ